MPAWAATLLVGGFTVGTNLLITAYYYGQLTNRVANLERRADETDTSRKDQWQQINETARGLEKVKGKLGVNGV